MKTFIATLMLLLSFSNTADGGEFMGDLVLLPEGCQQTDARICRLGAELTYKSSRDPLVWQTSIWIDNNGESGTTDGASIPGWAQPIVGDPYDPSYLKAAIVHDHYCYKENHVRTWRQTHRMFYDALSDLGVDRDKAKIMYFAVYLFGPHWIKIVPGEYCGENCIKNRVPSGQRWEKDRYANDESQSEIKTFVAVLEKNPNMSIEEIEAYAEQLNPDDFFFKNGSTYVPLSPSDPNMRPQM